MVEIQVGSMKIQADKGKNLLSVLRDNGIFVDAPCGGTGHCGKCKVKIAGEIPPVTETEQALLTRSEIVSGTRLACLTDCTGTMRIMLPEYKTVSKAGFLETAQEIDNGFCPGETGIAVDIGTTTLAVYFYELKSGNMTDVRSGLNLQRRYGADVISRISACEAEQDALRKMGDSIVSQINGYIREYGKKIASAVIVGNTTMLHLLTGLDPSGIAKAPYLGQSLFGVMYAGHQLGLQVDGEVYLPPCISSYVGADITAGLIAMNLDRSKEHVFYIDIGTNGEMALCKGNTIFCCSVAAGPAFEGAKIKFGTGSVAGAINRVWYDGGVKYTTIDDAPPVGICGSGLIDAVAVMVETGIVDETGRFMDDQSDEFFVSESISITRQDIREVQLAKSAVAAGIETLMKYGELETTEIDKSVIAGGFGSYINPRSAVVIGLLPKAFTGKLETVGN